MTGGEGGVDEVAAQELGTTEHEEIHPQIVADADDLTAAEAQPGQPGGTGLDGLAPVRRRTKYLFQERARQGAGS